MAFAALIFVMDHPGFWTQAGPFSLQEIAQFTSAELPEPFLERAETKLTFLAPLDEAMAADLTFFDNRKFTPLLKDLQAGAVFIAPNFVSKLNPAVTPLITKEPHKAFAKAIELFVPEARLTRTAFGTEGIGAPFISPSARIEDDVVIEAGAVVGAEAQIGRGTRIAAGAVIGYRVAIGRDCHIGPSTTLTHSLIGNRVIIHAGARLGQDGFGFVMSPKGHYKVPQIGRVIVQDDVEIGANTTIDRGALRDTIIGEGTKIDNLVQIGHNVVIGRHCIIVSQAGISGSTILEDFVAMGGQAGTLGHIRIGAGAQIAASSGVGHDVPAGERWGGMPARPITLWFREIGMLRKLVKKKSFGDEPEF